MISPRELQSRQAAGETITLIDVRTAVEFREVHIPFARNAPSDRLDVAEFANSSGPVYVVCRSGNRAATACAKLASAGVNAINVEGGTLAWIAAGLPVVRGRAAMSLERQVRITAGAIVFSGAILAIVVHPWLVAIPAGIGFGLMFSGITDTCTMGLLLAKMPWNRIRDGAACIVPAANR